MTETAETLYYDEGFWDAWLHFNEIANPPSEIADTLFEAWKAGWVARTKVNAEQEAK